MRKKTRPQTKQQKYKEKLSSNRKKATIKQCIWAKCGGSECSDNIIAAHSIQREKILRAIADAGEVYFLGTLPSEDMTQFNGVFEKKGIAAFSTFQGFCGGHDKTIFQPIEDKAFTETIEQKNIYAFRAAAKEFHTISESINLKKGLLGNRINQTCLPSASSLPDSFKGMLRKKETDEKLRYDLNQAMISESELKMICNHMKNVLDGANPEFEHVYYSFDQEYPIACNTTFIPYYDYNGQKILTQVELEFLASNQATIKTAKNVFLNVFPEDGRTHVIFTFFKNNQAFKDSIEQLFKLNVNEIKKHLSSILLNYAENLAFKPNYVETNFNDAEKEKIKKIFIASIKDRNAFHTVGFSLFIDEA